MARRTTSKSKKSLRRKSSRRAHGRRTKRRASGGGWADLPKGAFNQIAVNPGNQIHFPFPGPGKDCTGNPLSIRPGWIWDYPSKGLPGLSGGNRRNKKNKTRGGASMPMAATTQLGSALSGPVTNPNLPPVSGSLTAKPAHFPDTTGAGGSVGRPDAVMSMPGVPVQGQPLIQKVPIAELSKSADAENLQAPKQAGGRYGFFPGMGPLNPVNGVGTTPAPFGRIPCEIGTYNPLNPNPGDIQRLSTAPLVPAFVTGKLAGGGSIPAGTSFAASSANFPVVTVGAPDSMRYYAPTAGYRNDFMTFRAPSPVPGLTIQTPYPAGAFNQACIKTGGSHSNKKNKKNGGAQPVALDAGEFTKVTMPEIWTRSDFDGTNKLLPVKFGGKRRTHRGLRKTRRHSKK